MEIPPQLAETRQGRFIARLEALAMEAVEDAHQRMLCADSAADYAKYNACFDRAMRCARLTVALEARLTYQQNEVVEAAQAKAEAARADEAKARADRAREREVEVRDILMPLIWNEHDNDTARPLSDAFVAWLAEACARADFPDTDLDQLVDEALEHLGLVWPEGGPRSAEEAEVAFGYLAPLADTAAAADTS